MVPIQSVTKNLGILVPRYLQYSLLLGFFVVTSFIIILFDSIICLLVKYPSFHIYWHFDLHFCTLPVGTFCPDFFIFFFYFSFICRHLDVLDTNPLLAVYLFSIFLYFMMNKNVYLNFNAVSPSHRSFWRARMLVPSWTECPRAMYGRWQMFKNIY